MKLTHTLFTVLPLPGAAGAKRQKLVVALCAVSSAIALGSEARAQVTERASVATGGAQGSGSSTGPSVSPDGRYMAFLSFSSNLVAGDTNLRSDIFVRDRSLGTTERVSVATGGAQGNENSGFGPSISADGRYVAFSSGASNLVVGDTNLYYDVFVRDRLFGTTVRASVGAGGVQGNASSVNPSISDDGQCVAFWSSASNLVLNDTNMFDDVFVRDLLLLSTERVSVATGGTQGFFESRYPSISAGGNLVVFVSRASNLVAGDTNGDFDVFVRNRLFSTTERVSVATSGAQGNAGSLGVPCISDDGRYVAFESSASNLVAGDTNTDDDVFLRDRLLDTTARVSVGFGGVQGNAHSVGPSISADGRYVGFSSDASNLVVGDTNGFYDVFVRDRQIGTTWRASLATGGTQGNEDSWGSSIIADGRYVAFYGLASNLVAGDTNGDNDVFVHDRDADGFTSLCDPGVVVIACPCSNPPSGPGRGCDNSSATGGASISAAGVAYLAIDSLVFTTSGEKPTATSILLQGDASAPAGLVFGQGVRCVGGTLKRLYVKTASGGGIVAPNLGAGDPTVSARSAALGDLIPPGASRWYTVYYRDPIVLGGCPAASTFNATQSGSVGWWP